MSTDAPPRRALITAGQGVNIGLVIVLLGAAWQLGERVADLRVSLAQTQGDIQSLSVTVENLRQEVRDIRTEMKGNLNESRTR